MDASYKLTYTLGPVNSFIYYFYLLYIFQITIERKSLMVETLTNLTNGYSGFPTNIYLFMFLLSNQQSIRQSFAHQSFVNGLIHQSFSLSNFCAIW